MAEGTIFGNIVDSVFSATCGEGLKMGSENEGGTGP